MFLPYHFILIAVILIIYFSVASKQDHTVDWTSIISSNGDRLPDFSYCGYHGSDISLPAIDSQKVTVLPASNASEDMAPAIQEAIETIALGGGGVLELPPGRLYVSAGMQLRSNVVITGSQGSETTLVLIGQPSEPVFILGHRGNATKAKYGVRSAIVDQYVPIGSSEITILNSTGFTVNQSVYISRAATTLWLRDNGMLDLERDGVAQTWIPVSRSELLLWKQSSC